MSCLLYTWKPKTGHNPSEVITQLLEKEELIFWLLSYWIICPVYPFKICIAVPKYPKIFFFALRCKLIYDKKLNIKIIFTELICIAQKKYIYMLKRFYQMSMQLLLSSKNTWGTISTECANGTQFMIGDPIILLVKTWSPFIWGAGEKKFSKASWVECTADLFLEVALVQGIP